MLKHFDNERAEKGKDKETGRGESKVKVNLLPFLLSLKGKPNKKGKK